MATTLSDAKQRRDAVKSLLSSLSPWELIEIRHQLCNGDFPILGLAGLQHLPSEIICVIGLSLSIRDVVNCRLVSRSWREAWSNPAVARFICRFRFPGLLELDQDAQDPSTLLLEASKRYLKRHELPGPGGTVTWANRKNTEGRQVNLQPHGTSSPFNRAEPVIYFSHGLIAWQRGDETDHTIVHLDNLHDFTHRKLVFGTSLLAGYRLALKALGTKLMVALRIGSSGGNRILHVMNHQVRAEKEVTLPAPFETCYVHDETVIIITQPGTVIMWRWNGKSTIIDEVMADADAEGRRPQPIPGVLSHPTRTDIFFLARLFKSRIISDSKEENRHKFVVTKYENGKAIQKYEKIVQNPPPSNENRNGDLIHFNLPDRLFGPSLTAIGQSCQRMNSYGLHMLALYDIGPSRAMLGDTIPWSLEYGTWIADCFNVVSERFHQIQYAPLPAAVEVVNEPEFNYVADDRVVLHANLLDDCAIFQYQASMADRTTGPRDLVRFYACSLDGQELAPPVNTYVPVGTHRRLVHRTQGVTFLFRDEEFSVVATADGYYWWSSEAPIVYENEDDLSSMCWDIQSSHT